MASRSARGDQYQYVMVMANCLNGLGTKKIMKQTRSSRATAQIHRERLPVLRVDGVAEVTVEEATPVSVLDSGSMRNQKSFVVMAWQVGSVGRRTQVKGRIQGFKGI